MNLSAWEGYKHCEPVLNTVLPNEAAVALLFLEMIYNKLSRSFAVAPVLVDIAQISQCLVDTADTHSEETLVSTVTIVVRELVGVFVGKGSVDRSLELGLPPNKTRLPVFMNLPEQIIDDVTAGSIADFHKSEVQPGVPGLQVEPLVERIVEYLVEDVIVPECKKHRHTNNLERFYSEHCFDRMRLVMTRNYARVEMVNPAGSPALSLFFTKYRRLVVTTRFPFRRPSMHKHGILQGTCLGVLACTDLPIFVATCFYRSVKRMIRTRVREPGKETSCITYAELQSHCGKAVPVDSGDHLHFIHLVDGVSD
jgi:hypothetical protein